MRSSSERTSRKETAQGKEAHILLPRFRARRVLVPELAAERLAVLDVLRADEVDRDLDAVGELWYLIQRKDGQRSDRRHSRLSGGK